MSASECQWVPMSVSECQWVSMSDNECQPVSVSVSKYRGWDEADKLPSVTTCYNTRTLSWTSSGKSVSPAAQSKHGGRLVCLSSISVIWLSTWRGQGRSLCAQHARHVVTTVRSEVGRAQRRANLSCGNGYLIFTCQGIAHWLRSLLAWASPGGGWHRADRLSSASHAARVIVNPARVIVRKLLAQWTWSSM